MSLVKRFSYLTMVLVLTTLFSACQTPGVVMEEESNYSVKQHRVAVAQVLRLIASVSINGREITSAYHDRNLKFFEVTPQTKERLYTNVIILGSRRPYRFSVEVHVEQRDPDSRRFVDIGLDEGLARKQAYSIKKVLSQSLESGGVFDEQDPF